jgi:hypothetical protein
LASFDDIIEHYRRHISLPWRDDVPAAGRVWIAWYDKALERRVRGQMHEFEHATVTAKHGWRQLDLVPLFPAWMAAHEFFAALVDQPEELRSLLPEFEEHLISVLKEQLDAATSNDVVAVAGCGSLFGLVRVSTLITRVAPAIKGRMLVNFPGRHDANVYRLLDARDGWNYHAIPIPPVDAA